MASKIETEVHTLLLLAVPNISEGGDDRLIAECAAAAQLGGARTLDLHSDAVHNRSVLTIAGHPAELVAGMTELASLASDIDMSEHRGVHPRLGGLDVCPFVPYEATMADAVTVARTTAISIARRSGLPVYLYGEASLRPETRELPDIRRGGLEALAERARTDQPPDQGPRRIDLARGVVCVGARGPLIAFNVWLASDGDVARRIASEVREPGTLRALGIRLESGTSQVSMNLTQPHSLGIDEAFDRVAASAATLGARVTNTEIVGLVPERFLPSPDATAARLLFEPGRSVESVLRREG
ncbi:MAG: glutamate formimidoyltransferase [Actinomycetota bacterium]|nr:glutamate formiminotransferase [Actinomycetota bacterium]